MSSKVKEEKRDWEQVFTMNRWTPDVKGDEIVGIYTKRRDNVGVRDYTFYTLELEGGENKDILGTTLLNQMMDQVSLGWEVRIVYQGEKPPTPPHKPLKLFDVYRRPAGVDRVSGAAGDDHETEAPESPVINTKDDEEVRVFVDGVEEDLREQSKTVNEVSVWSLAREQAGEDKEFLARVKVEIRRREY